MRLTPIVFALVELFLRYDLTLAEINPLARLADGRFVVLDGHVDMEAEARELHAALLAELGIGKDETRQARPPTESELAGARVNAVDHRGVAGNVVEFDGNLGLVIGAGGGSLTLEISKGLDTISPHSRAHGLGRLLGRPSKAERPPASTVSGRSSPARFAGSATGGRTRHPAEKVIRRAQHGRQQPIPTRLTGKY